MKNVKILSSERFDHDGKPHWRVRMAVEFMDGVKNVSHCFPEEIFIFRAAEYGFDPADVDTLLDIVLTEIHAVPDPGTHLYEVSDRDVARGHHMNRCARQKLKMRLSTRSNKSVLKVKAADPNDPVTDDDVSADHPLEPIRQHLQLNPLDSRDVDHCRNLVDGVFKLRRRPGNGNNDN
jgi:hypothetical protein